MADMHPVNGEGDVVDKKANASGNATDCFSGSLARRMFSIWKLRISVYKCDIYPNILQFAVWLTRPEKPNTFIKTKWGLPAGISG